MFKCTKIVGGRGNVPEPEVQVAGTDIEPGMALKLDNGVLVKCNGADAPEYIAHGYAKNGENAAVYAVAHDQVYEVRCSADPKNIKPGDKLTIGTDALSVTATSGGAATVISVNEATKAGDKLVVKF